MNERMRTSGLFEAHLPVSDVDRAIAFYGDVVGLGLGLYDQDIGAAFFWIGAPGRSMLGLWDAGPAPMFVSLHVAFAASLDDVLDAPARLRRLGVMPLSFHAEETSEPSVIGWMPAAAVYFRDPDGHLLELVAMLEGAPDPERRILPWSDWCAKDRR